MNTIAYTLLRLSLLVALVLVPATQPIASAREPRQTTQSCKPTTPKIGTITGTVRGSDGQPLQGVVVTAYATTGAVLPAGETDAAGKYGNAQLPNGSYLLEFKPPPGSLQVAWYNNASAPLAATPVDVSNGSATNGIDMTLPAGVQFNVTLRDPERNPLAQSLVSVFDRHDREVASGRTNAMGQVITTPGLPPGSYRLLARPPYDSPLLAHYHNQQPTLDAANPITVTQAISIDVAMTLQHGAKLSGTVTDADSGAPLAGVSVAIKDADGETTATGVALYTQTDAQGHYRYAGLASGSYRVEFKASLPQPGSHAPLRRLVTLSAPNAQTGFDAALTRGGAITGRVTTPNGTPIPDVAVNVRDGNAIDIVRYSAADGTYAIYGLASGRYTLAFAHDNHQPHVLAEQETVTAPNTTTLPNIVLSPGSAIAGKVTDPDGKPVANATVHILDAATRKTTITTAPTNADGVYTTTATLASGSYIVKFEPPSSDRSCHLAIKYSGNATTAAVATPVQVNPPVTLSGINAALDYGGLITGRISDAASGLPLNGTVQVYDSSGALVATGYPGFLGHYRTSMALPQGVYRVQFRVDGYVPMFYGGATILETAAPVSSGASEVNMALPRGGTITGRITAADTGAPLEHAAVTLYGANDRVIATQLTAFDGSYQFKGNLPSGTYRIGVAPGKQLDGTSYFTGYEPIFSGGASGLAQAQPIAIVAPRTVTANLAMPLTTTPTPTTPTPTTPTPTTPTNDKQPVYLPLVQR